MSRFRCVWLCAIVALTGAVLLRPASVHAASGMLTTETSLLASPDPAAAVIALLPAGTAVAIDGPPVDGFYPVTASDLSGWIPGETLAFEKDTPEPAAPEESAANPLEDDTDEMASVDDPAALDPATDTSAALTESPPVAERAAADEALPGGEPVSAEAPSAVNDAAPGDAPAVDSVAAPSEPAWDRTGASGPIAPGDESPPLESASTAPEAAAPPADPTVTPNPAAEDAPVGPASVAVDAPVLAGPGPEYGFIATAPAGSTVEQTGHVINGYVTVQHAEVTGWVALEHLGAPSTGIDETPPAETAPGEAPRADASPVDAPPAETSLTKSAPIEAAPSDAGPAEEVPVVAS